ncbi:MAG TPA: chalcone isomerase family protein [Gemmatimonadaceae bacterium]|nr:chalcone isomerase family protein [Gemmatimonadaceae bacterium]
MLHLLAIALSATLVAPPADTTKGVTLADVTLPATVDVAGHALVLNGAAVRKKFIVKVYVAGLYLTMKSKDPDAILAADSARRMALHFVHDVGKDKLCEAWNDGLKDNTPNPSAQLTADFKTLCDDMADIKDGQVMTMTYVPGTGTTIEIAGAAKGTIAGKDFADAVLRTWIGPKPGPGEGFKKGVLGAQ